MDEKPKGFTIRKDEDVFKSLGLVAFDNGVWGILFYPDVKFGYSWGLEFDMYMNVNPAKECCKADWVTFKWVNPEEIKFSANGLTYIKNKKIPTSEFINILRRAIYVIENKLYTSRKIIENIAYMFSFYTNDKNGIVLLADTRHIIAISTEAYSENH